MSAGVHKADRLALGAGARGAADAVDISFGDFRQVVIVDVADARNVDAAGGDVRSPPGRGF